MQIPNAERAVVAKEKITEYLLNPENPRNQGEAGFFTRFGFTAQDWQTLATALREVALRNDVQEMKVEAFGTKYVVVGPLSSPDGRDPLVKTIWQIDNASTAPRFISAYPA